MRSSTPTASTTPGLDTYDANLALGYSEEGRDYTVDLPRDDVLDAEEYDTDCPSTPELSSRPHQQILVVHGDRHVAGGCLGQASPCVRLSTDPQLG